jgi:hypothetical protein
MPSLPKHSYDRLPLNDADSNSEASSLTPKYTEGPMLPKHPRKIAFYTRDFVLISLTSISILLCVISIGLIIQTNTLKARLDGYSATLIDVTNRKWGFGEALIPAGFDGSQINATNKPSLASDEHLPPFLGNGVKGQPAFPSSLDIVDDRRPNDVIEKDWNVVVTSHVRILSLPFFSGLTISRQVSTIIQYTTAFPATDPDVPRPWCVIRGYFPSIKKLYEANASRTLTTTYDQVEIYQLAKPIPGPFWETPMPEDLYFPRKSHVTFNSKPERLAKLGNMDVRPGRDAQTEPFPCPFSNDQDKKKKRIAIEISCQRCMVAYNHVFEYPIMGVFRVVGRHLLLMIYLGFELLF